MTPAEAQLVQTLGVVGVLIVVLGAIMTGRLWPKHHVDAVRKDTLKAANESGKTVATELINHFEGKFISRKIRRKRMGNAIRVRRKQI